MKSVFACVLFSAGGLIWSQSAPLVHAGSVERVKVHARTLENNLEGDSADRDVSVYLPPSYKSDKSRRYPVVYMLHGFTDSDELWFGFKKHWISLPAVLDKTLAGSGIREIIVVMPNALTRYYGSMYSNSPTTGNWEDFVSSELVAYVDSHYRTLPQASSRGLAGHSMGGYGAIRIGMRHPAVFSSIYMLSPCCMTPPSQQPGPGAARAEAVKEFAEIEKADFMTKATLASAAAWSPDPSNPPLFLALPWRNGAYQPAIGAKWAANAPLAMIDQYIANLKTLKAIAFDAGSSDQPIAATIQTLDGILSSYRVAHTFEIYEGNHVDHIAERIETKMMPFFSKNLTFDAAPAR